MSDRTLTPEQRDDAIRMWRTGFSLGEIARSIGCSVYTLSPWIYAAGAVHNTPADLARQEPAHAEP